jgi:hypothetical protein
MEMTDMKRTKAEKKARMETGKSPPIDGEDYPYGLEVRLDHEQLEKLGVTNLPKVGSKMHLHSHAHVTHVSEESRDGARRRSVTLQMRKMSLKPKMDTDEDKNAGMKGAIDKALAPEAESGED